jgi:hypothetical protein
MRTLYDFFAKLFSGFNFWSGFWANFLSDLLAGGLVGGLLALWVGKMLNTFEQSQQRKQQREAELNKTIHYLGLLNTEIRALLKELPSLRNAFTEYPWGREIRVETPFWDVVERSGELPRLLNPNLLWSLTRFHSNLAYAKRARDLLIETWLVPQPSSVPGMKEKKEAFFNLTVHGLDEAMKVGKGLAEQVDSEIDSLKKHLERIK